MVVGYRLAGKYRKNTNYYLTVTLTLTISISGWESPACDGALVSLGAWSRSETDSRWAADTPADTHSQSAGGGRWLACT